jgi:hypothetical protein
MCVRAHYANAKVDVLVLGDAIPMLENTIEREKRRQIILKGISENLKHSEISAQLGVNRWVIMGDLKFMRRNGDRGLIQAEKAQVKVREEKVLLFTKEKRHFKQNERFLHMTGITIQEKSFRNMIDFNKHALLKILKSKDQQAAIIKLPTSIQKTLKRHGIITTQYHDNEITERAEKYLTRKNPAREP